MSRSQGDPNVVAGLDYAFSGGGKRTFAAAVVPRVKPVFVSVGHKCRLEDAIRITLACATRYRIPEPTRLAHQTVTRL